MRSLFCLPVSAGKMGGAVGLSGDADAHLGGGRHSSRFLGLEPACSQVLCRRTTWRVAAALLQYLEYFCPGAHRPVKQAPVIAPAVNKQAGGDEDLRQASGAGGRAGQGGDRFRSLNAICSILRRAGLLPLLVLRCHSFSLLVCSKVSCVWRPGTTVVGADKECNFLQHSI